MKKEVGNRTHPINNETIHNKGRMDDSENLKTAFLQNISHEIRTPLNGIIGFSELLGEEGISREDIKKFTAIICQNGDRLIEIINNVLEISKIQTGQIHIVRNPVRIDSIFSDLTTGYKHFAESKNIRLNSQIPQDLSRVLYSDEVKVHQILKELIKNAIKFSNSGDVNFGYKIQDSEIRFFVEDMGIGIPPEILDKVFERFFQANQPYFEVHEGAGLGLSICKGLLDLLGGRIWIESEVGKGTTVFFTLPLLPLTLTSQTFVFNPEFHAKGYTAKILIAEDDWVNFTYLKIFLEDSGISVIHAENGKKAVDMVMDCPDIDLILMDINMPVMDGIEAAKLIKQVRPALPIIAHTTRASDADLNPGPYGCDEYLSKPFEIDQLNLLLTRYLIMPDPASMPAATPKESQDQERLL